MLSTKFQNKFLLSLVTIITFTFMLNACGKKDTNSNGENQSTASAPGEQAGGGLSANPVEGTTIPGTGSTTETSKNYSVSIDTAMNSNSINEIMLMLNGLSVKFDANSFKKLDDTSLIVAGSGYLSGQALFVKTDLLGNVDNTFNSGKGFVGVKIPNYTFENYSGKLLVNPNTKDIFYMGKSHYLNDTSKSFYTLISIKPDGSENKVFNGNSYFIDTSYNAYSLKDFILDGDDKFTAVVFQTTLKSVACTHSFSAPMNYNCVQLGTTVSDEVNRIIPGDRTKNQYFYVGQTRYTPKLWGMENGVSYEYKLQGLDIGFAQDFARDETGFYVVGCSTLTDIYSRLTIWKFNNDFTLDQNFATNGKKVYSQELSGCFNNTFVLKNKKIFVSTEGAKSGTDYSSFLTISEIDFLNQERKIIFQDYKSYNIKSAEKIGDDLYLLINNTTLGITKFIKTKISQM